MSSTRSLGALFDEWIDDPVAFCDDVFDMKPREWQPAFMRAVAANTTKRRTAIKACRDAGKTAAVGYLALWWLATRPQSLVITTAPVWQQVEESLWVEVRKLWWRSKLPKLFPKWEVLTTAVKTGDPEWRAFGLASNRPENFEGPHGRSVLLIYDEAKRVDRMVYEMLQGLLTNVEWREVAISTPGPRTGWFYDAYTKDAELWELHSITAWEVERLHGWAERMRWQWSENSPTYRQQVLAEFSNADVGGVFPDDLISACVNLSPAPTKKDGERWPRVLGVDPAGKGTDEFAVAFRHGPIVEKVEAWSGWPEMQSVGEVTKLARDWRAEKLIVEKPGLGGPIIDALRENGLNVVEFNPGERAWAREEYDNLKTEVAFGLRERMVDGEVKLPRDERLSGQLSSYQVGRSQRGLTKLLDPKTGGSPDRADALICAFAADFSRPSIATGSPSWL